MYGYELSNIDFSMFGGRDVVQVQCNTCDSFMPRFAYELSQRADISTGFYCTQSCRDLATYTKLECVECGKFFTRRKTLIRTERSFCSVACTNKYKTKRHINKCNITLKRTIRAFNTAIKHLDKIQRKQLNQMLTLADLADFDGHTPSMHSKTRGRARREYLKHASNKCKCCGYKNHIHVCHIQPVSSFPIDTLLSVVNATDNLIGLCPNCHWELDNMYDGDVKELFDNCK